MRSLFPLLLAFATAASAQLFDVGVGGGVNRLSSRNLGSISSDTGAPLLVSLEDGWRINFRGTFNTETIFGYEFGYSYNRTSLKFSDGTQSSEQGMAIHQGGINLLLYAIPEGKPVRPFVTGGGHFANFVPPGASVTSGGGSNKFGVNYGGGVKFKVRGPWGARIDFRQYHTPKPFDLPGVSGWLRQTEISAGFMFML
jgi:opacity protein-like surface antigen